MKPISIAIDGPSGAGKSTIARKSAEKFGFIYVDTGAIYRTVGLAAYRRGIASKDSAAVIAMLPELHIELRHGADGLQRMFLDGEDVSDAIRMPEISIYASDVSAVPEVRAFLMEMQRSFARTQNVIMDGRPAEHGQDPKRPDGRPGHRHRCAAGRGAEDLSYGVRGGARQTPPAGAGEEGEEPSL